MTDYNIKIKEIEYKIDKFGSSILKLQIDFENINFTILNSLRKISINQIPIYAFHSDKISIFKNSSVYDNTYMKLRLSQLPIKIDHNVDFLALKYYKDVSFMDPKLERHGDDINDIEFYFKAKNNGPSSILDVTTNDLRIIINDELIENKKLFSEEYPILLLKLRINEEIECSMKSVLSIGENESIFNCANTYYDEITENRYYFMVESLGQFDEYTILIKACKILIEKYKIIKENITNDEYQNITTPSNMIILEIENEDYTVMGPINYILQSTPSVIFSGITKPNFMQKNILLKLKVDEKHNPFKLIGQSIDECIKIYENMLGTITKLSGK